MVIDVLNLEVVVGILEVLYLIFLDLKFLMYVESIDMICFIFKWGKN